jgi:DNA-binding FadR family transcriptional regulator
MTASVCGQNLTYSVADPGAAVLAARVAGPEEKADIRNAIERMQAAERGDGDPLDPDIAFHIEAQQVARRLPVNANR